jgi:anti-anti-sigma regulatory factor
MTEKLRATVESDGDTSVVKLVGFLDEENKLKRLVEKIPAGTAMIDLAGVERINSLGIRDWVNWMSALEQNGTRPVLVSCSPAIVAQINLVKNFTGHGAVKSFQVPYHCRECDEDRVIVVETSEMSSPETPPPTVPCKTCKRAMDVDEMPESYFAFLGQVHLEDLARGSSASVKARVKTRERRSSPPARRSQPSLSAYQTPGHGTPRISSQELLGKKRPSRPSAQRMALGSSERISSSQLAPPPERTEVATPKSYTMMLVAIIGILVAGIAALSYVVFLQ